MSERPAPPVTVVDPGRPSLVLTQDEVGSTPRGVPLLLKAELALGLVLLLLLLAALHGTSRLRAERDAEARLERDLAMTLDLFRAAGIEDTASVFGLLSARQPVVLTALGGQGWRWPRLRDVQVGRGPVALSVGRDVDCASRVQAPTELVAEVRLPDASRRRVRVAVQRDRRLDLRPLDRVCGDVPPEDALVLRRSVVERGPRGLQVQLTLENTGVRPLRVLAVDFPGFALRGPALVLPRRPRVPGGQAPERVLALGVAVVDCPTARAAITAAAQTIPPDLLGISVSDGRQLGLVRVDVAGVLAYLQDAAEAACR